MAIILTERSVAQSITKVYQERLMKSAELVAKKELVSLSTAIDSAAVKGQDSLSFKLSTAITRLASQYKAVALNIIETDINDAHYDVQVQTDPKTGDTVGYDIFWTDDSEEDPEEEDVSHASSISAAMATKSDVTVRLTEDMQIEEPIVIEAGKKLTINLNSNDIGSNMNGVLFQANGGELVINGTIGSEITSSGAIAQASNGGKITVNGGIYNTTSGNVALSASGENSELNITDGTFNTIEPAAMAFSGATVNITGGTFTSTDNFAIGTNGTKSVEKGDWGNNTINIDNCVINAAITSSGYEAVGIYVANNDIVNIGPNVVINVHNGCGVCQRAGQVTIRQGAEILLTTDDPEMVGWVGDKKRKLAQSGVIYAEIDNYPGATNPGDRPMQLIIEDGVKITGITHSIEISSEAAEPNVQIGQGIYNPAYPEE